MPRKIANTVVQTCTLLSTLLMPYATLHAQPLPSDKPTDPLVVNIPAVDPSLTAQAASGPVRVIIKLKDQPHRAVAAKARADFAVTLAAAQARVQAAAESPVPNEPALQAAQEAVDKILLQMKGRILSETQAASAAAQQALTSRATAVGATDVRSFTIANMLTARVPASAISALATDPLVANISVDRLLVAKVVYGTPSLGSASYWNSGFTGAGQTVGVIDTGVDASHPAFGGVANVSGAVFHGTAQTAGGYCDNPSSVDDLNGHGTHVAGIIASRGQAGWTTHQGVAKGSRIVNLKAGFRGCDGGGYMFWSDMAAALQYGWFYTPAYTFNLSFGSDYAPADTAEAQFIDDMIATYGFVLTISTGNSGPANLNVGTPALAWNAIAVGAMDDRNTTARADDALASYSSRGPTSDGRYKPDVTAPGSDILSTRHDWEGTNPDFVSFHGTSMAAPAVSGAAALMRQTGLATPAIRALLINSADGNGWNRDTGYGYVNLGAAKTSSSSFTAAVAPRASQYYVGTLSSGALKATLTWDRYFSSATWYMNDLDLHLWSRTTGAFLASSASVAQNTEQASTNSVGGIVVQVFGFSASFGLGYSYQQYGLSVSRSGFVPVQPPALQLTCTAPASVLSGAVFTLSCTARNGGGLEVLGVEGTVHLPSGWSPCAMSFGRIAAGGSVVRTCSVTAASVGAHAISASILTYSWGNSWNAASPPVNIQVSAAPLRISGKVSLNSTSGAGLGSVRMNLTGAATAAVTTDSLGKYAFSPYPYGSGPYTITPTLAGYIFNPPQVTVPSLTAVTSHDFVATALGISGRITTVAGAAVSGVAVQLSGSLARSATTNTRGEYQFTGLTAGGDYIVTPVKAGVVFHPAKAVVNDFSSTFRADFESVLSAGGNNDAATATVLARIPVSIVQDTAAFTANATDPRPSCTNVQGSRTAWFVVTPAASGILSLKTLGTSYDTVLSVYRNGTPVACNDDSYGSSQSSLSVQVEGGGTYHILVGGYNASTPGGRLVLSVSQQ